MAAGAVGCTKSNMAACASWRIGAAAAFGWSRATSTTSKIAFALRYGSDRGVSRSILRIDREAIVERA
jgi:hypothetical protein